MDIKQLEQRITDLEKIFGITDDNIPELCLGDEILTTQQMFIEMNYKQDKELNSQVLKLVQFQNSTYSNQHLLTHQKAQIVQTMETQLAKDAQHLNSILKLGKHVDFDPIIRLKSKQEDIALLQTSSKLTYNSQSSELKCENNQTEQLKTKYTKVTEDAESLVQANQDLVDNINQKIMFYHSLKK